MSILKRFCRNIASSEQAAREPSNASYYAAIHCIIDDYGETNRQLPPLI
jgi:hypothetical protein